MTDHDRLRDEVSFGRLRLFAAIYKKVWDAVQHGTPISLSQICNLPAIRADRRFMGKLERNLSLPKNALIGRGNGGECARTPLGDDLFEAARRILEEYDGLAVRGFAPTSVRVECVPAAVPFLMGNAFDLFAADQQFRGVKVHVNSQFFSDDVRESVLLGGAQIGVGYFEYATGSGVDSERLFASRIVLLHHCDHRFAGVRRGEVVPFRSLAEETVILLPKSSVFGPFVEPRLPAPVGSGRHVVVPSVMHAYDWVRAKRGVTFCLEGLPTSWHDTDVVTSQLDAEQPPESVVALWLYVRRGKPRSEAAKEFLNCIRVAAGRFKRAL